MRLRQRAVKQDRPTDPTDVSDPVHPVDEADPVDRAEPAEIEVPYWLVHTVEAANATFWRMLRRLPGLLVQAGSLAWRTSRAATIAVVAFQLGVGLASAVGLVNVVGVLDGLLAAGPTPDRIRAAVPSLAVVVCATALRAALTAGRRRRRADSARG